MGWSEGVGRGKSAGTGNQAGLVVFFFFFFLFLEEKGWHISTQGWRRG